MTAPTRPAPIPFRTEVEQREAIERVARHLEQGGLIAYPTETVYGFGCTLRADAVSRLAAAKRRAADRPFLLLIAGPAMLPALEWTETAKALARAYWPGALTLVLNVKDHKLPPEVVAPAGTVAVRATSHSGVRRLVERVGPLTSTSANVPAEPPALNAEQAGLALAAIAGEWPALTLDGGTLPASTPSTIVDCSVAPARLVRAGVIDAKELAETINGIESA